MACALRQWFVASIVLMFMKLTPLAHGAPHVPCYFIFGDSLVDNGNNNGLQTLAKANYYPYGIDFPGGPTGRFCNGRNLADFLAENLGFDTSIPPFANATGDILRGVNYGSGGAGIRDETGHQLGGRVSLNKQLQNHQITVSKIAEKLGSQEAAKEHLKKCLYTVGMGSNDYINNYFKPDRYPTSRRYSPENYASALIQQYSTQIRTLYDNGARKGALFGLGLIGCIPAQLTTQSADGGSCIGSRINSYVQLFNTKLKSLVDELNKDLGDAKFTYINITGISSGDPSLHGITNLTSPCCQVSSSFGRQCVPQSVPCSNRDANAFFDAFHPTEIVNKMTASRAYTAASPTDAYPFDIRHLVSS